VTVVAYSTLRGMLKTALPSVPGLGPTWITTPYRMGAYHAGPYRNPRIRGLGYVSPAATIGSQTMMSRGMVGLGSTCLRGPMNVAPAMVTTGTGLTHRVSILQHIRTGARSNDKTCAGSERSRP